MMGERYKRFLLFGSKEENILLKKAVDYYPYDEPVKSTTYYKRIAIYTAAPRFGVVVDSRIRKKCKIIILSGKNFPVTSDPTDRLFRFLVVTLLHEIAHTSGFNEFDAHEKAFEWHNKYISKHNIKAEKYDWTEKSNNEDFVSGRDWIYVSRLGDINDHIAASIGTELVESFINKCASDGGVTSVMKKLVRGYIEGVQEKP